MKQDTGSTQRKDRGFTLIELMLVIVILGILAGVTVTQITGVSQDAKIAAAQTDIENIKMALRMFEVDMGYFPTEDQGLEELYTKTDEHRKYLEKAPKDPWGTEYGYRAESEHEMDFPDIWSNGKDKEEGTEDDVVSWDVGEESEGISSTGTGSAGTKSTGTSKEF